MNLAYLGLILFSVVLAAGSQVALKSGMSAAAVQAALASGDILALAWAVATSPFIVGGLFCFGVSVLCWLAVLAKIDLSQAYPFVALGTVITVVAGHLFFGEYLSLVRIGGIIAIVAGVALVGIS